LSSSKSMHLSQVTSTLTIYSYHYYSLIFVIIHSGKVHFLAILCTLIPQCLRVNISSRQDLHIMCLPGPSDFTVISTHAEFTSSHTLHLLFHLTSLILLIYPFHSTNHRHHHCRILPIAFACASHPTLPSTIQNKMLLLKVLLCLLLLKLLP